MKIPKEIGTEPILRALKRGLSGGELKTFLALALLGPGRAREVAQLAGISQRSAERGLRALEGHGLVRREEGGWRICDRPVADEEDLFSSKGFNPEQNHKAGSFPQATGASWEEVRRTIEAAGLWEPFREYLGQRLDRKGWALVAHKLGQMPAREGRRALEEGLRRALEGLAAKGEEVRNPAGYALAILEDRRGLWKPYLEVRGKEEERKPEELAEALSRGPIRLGEREYLFAALLSGGKEVLLAPLGDWPALRIGVDRLRELLGGLPCPKGEPGEEPGTAGPQVAARNGGPGLHHHPALPAGLPGGPGRGGRAPPGGRGGGHGAVEGGAGAAGGLGSPPRLHGLPVGPQPAGRDRA